MKTHRSQAFFISAVVYGILFLTGYILFSTTDRNESAYNDLRTLDIQLSLFQSTLDTPLQPSPPVEPIQQHSVTNKQTDYTPPVLKEPKHPPEPLSPESDNQISQVQHIEQNTQKAEVTPIETVAEVEEKQTQIGSAKYNAMIEAENHYLQKLQQQIAQYAASSYPTRAQRRKWEGDVTVQFTILANGVIQNIIIYNSSGRTILDEAALSVLRDTMNSRFLPFPEEIERDAWLIQLPVTYYLKP